MDYPARALASEAELRDAIRVNATVSATTIANLANAVTGLIEEYVEHDLVTRLTGTDVYREWHDLAVPQGYVDLRHAPVRDIKTLRTGLPSALFNFSLNDFVWDSEKGVLMLRRGAVNPGAWRPPGFIDFPEDYYVRGLGVKTGAGFNPGVGTVYVEYKGGFEDTDHVPGALRRAFLDTASRIYRAEENKSQGMAQQIGQGVGIVTKFNQDYMSPEVRDSIRRFKYHGKTARRTVEVGAVTPP